MGLAEGRFLCILFRKYISSNEEVNVRPKKVHSKQYVFVRTSYLA